METSEKRPDGEGILLRRLDSSLMNRASRISPYTSIEELHEFGTAIRLHEYLTTEHSFTKDEITALSQFRDPLEAAVYAMEETDFTQGSDICYWLERSGAKNELPLIQTEPAAYSERTSHRQKAAKKDQER